ncbi:DUF1559 family PulG-like putative transporter [Aquisphaera insulae]|uniref:DUF1559 family PulG-like putative transporter n=1 Tax=Aquisphaera insulae TaxID=2712864 RepID=UPI0013ECE7C2|nr:DUF1559 domain-containing protein [Aquisphaera insulae]
MKWVVIALAGLSMTFAAGRARGDDAPEKPPVTITLRPAAAPVPALRYRLLPPRHELVPGNAAIFYHRAVERLIEINLQVQLQETRQKGAQPPRPSQEAAMSWLRMPIAELPRAEIRNYLAIYDFCLSEVELGSIREVCDWEYYHRPVGYTFLISELQNMRPLIRLIVLKARLEIAEGRYDSAVHWLRTGFAVADHLTRAPIMIPMLIGCAGVNLLSGPLRDLSQAPGSPNLYWAIANLPRPLIDVRPSLDGEQVVLEQDFPELSQLDSGPWTLERSRAFSDDIINRFSRYLNDWIRLSRSSEHGAVESLGDRLVFASIIGRSYPGAKRRLIEKGRLAATVEAMPAVQVVALDSYLLYQEARDEIFKWGGLPYAQASAGMTHSASIPGIGWPALKDGIPFGMLLPAIQAGVQASALTQREIDAVQIFEAIRLLAAKNGGKLPPNLDALSEAPVPADPVTGKPYEYSIGGDSATLVAPAPAGQTNNPYLVLKYIVKLSPAVSLRESTPRNDDMMRTLPRSLPLVLALAATGVAVSADDPRPAAISPFLDAAVAAVARLDLAKVDADRLVHLWVAQRDQADGLAKLAAPVLDGLRKAGAKELYILFGLPGSNRSFTSLPPVVVPLEQGADAKAIGELLCGQGLVKGVAWETCATVHNAVFAGTREELERARRTDNPARPELAEALAGLGDTVAEVVVMPSPDARRVLEEIVPTVPAELGGAPVAAFTRGIPWAAAGLTADREPRIQVIVRGKDAAALRAVEQLGQGVRKIALASPLIAKNVPGFANIIDGLKPEVGPDRITLTLDPEKAAVAARAILLPARQSAARQDCMTNLKQIGLALHNYHSVHNSFPPAYSTDAAGKPLLSWRVLILPYLEQDTLFKEFHLDEPWDSPHNRPLIDRLPAVYRCAGLGDNPPPAGKTTYLTPRGEATIFPGATGTDIKSITDGTSCTIFVVDVPNDRAVTWSKPDDWEIATGVDPKVLLGRHNGGTNVLFADGSVQYFRDTISVETLKKLLTLNGGEVVPWDEAP